MSLPFFYEEEIPSTENFILNESTSKHLVQVLRMRRGEHLKLTNGKGKIVTAEIIVDDKKRTEVKISEINQEPVSVRNNSIAISLLKNNSRFEWFLEKATEIGISKIIPLVCERTEKIQFKVERIKAILISAMIQSQQSYLPELSEPEKFKKFVTQPFEQKKFIAHCINDDKKILGKEYISEKENLVLIGPEGDFTKEEIALAIQNNFIPVSLGSTRLRTETAGIVASVILCHNSYLAVSPSFRASSS